MDYRCYWWDRWWFARPSPSGTHAASASARRSCVSTYWLRLISRQETGDAQAQRAVAGYLRATDAVSEQRVCYFATGGPGAFINVEDPDGTAMKRCTTGVCCAAPDLTPGLYATRRGGASAASGEVELAAAFMPRSEPFPFRHQRRAGWFMVPLSSQERGPGGEVGRQTHLPAEIRRALAQGHRHFLRL